MTTTLDRTTFPITPTLDHLVVELDDTDELRPSGLIVPVVARDKPDVGVVLAAGPGARLDNGHTLPNPFTVGDRILYLRYGGTQFTHDGVKYLMLSAARDVLGVFCDTVGDSGT